MGSAGPSVQYTVAGQGVVHVTVSWDLTDTVRQDDVQINITPAFNPVFHWAPHLTPTDSNIIAQHVFRTPAMIVQSQRQQLVVVPDCGHLAPMEKPDEVSAAMRGWLLQA